LGKEGNLLGIYAGVEPTLRGFTAGGVSQPITGGRDNAYHIEAFYKYQLTDNISITPGAIFITNPGQNSGNDDAIIGTIRTTFTF
jgi:carbohydrate-selective porin OprB